MKKEDPPYQFKLHIFLKKDKEYQGNQRELRLQVLAKLDEFK